MSRIAAITVILMAGFSFCAMSAQAQESSTALYLWTQIVCAEGGCENTPGGSFVGRVEGLPFGLQLAARGDVSGYPGQEQLGDRETWRTAELYGAVSRPVWRHGQLDLGPACVYGWAVSFGDDAPLEHPETYACGVRVGVGAAGYAYVLGGKHEVAGPGMRLLVTVHVPLYGRWSVRADGAWGSPEERFVRSGLVLDVPGLGGR